MSKQVYELKHSDPNAFAFPNNNDQFTDASKAETNEQLDSPMPDHNQNEDIKERGQWSKGIEFLLSCISLSVGLGNVWRFPYVAYENGGGAFLIPYLLLLFIIGRPMYYMELVLGQFSGRGPIKVWKCVPALKGIGFAQIASTSYLIIFYNYLMALTVYYLFASFAKNLPWTECDNEWCNSTLNASSSEQYYENNVLHQSEGLEYISSISWRLVLCLVGSWALVYLSIIKGISSLGKVAYFTALFPYVVLIALLVVSLTQDGAWSGIEFFFKPEWEELLKPKVWYKAVEQSFFSLAVCFGSLIMYSSYNGFRNNVYKDAIIISILDTFTSLLAGCVTFAVLGTMATADGKLIKDIAKPGAGLAFVVYPEALSKIKFVPQLWSVLFFIMLFTLGIGSSVAMIETLLTSIRDEFTHLRRNKWILALVMCSFFCILGLPLTTDAGPYIMQLLDNYGVGAAAFFYGIAETIGIMWIYGIRQFCLDIKFMLNKTVGIFWKVTWFLTAPIALIIIFIYGNYEIFSDDKPATGIPSWGSGIGWGLAAVAVFQIPLWIIIAIYKQNGTAFQRIKRAFSPSPDWGPLDPIHFQEWQRFKYAETHGGTPAYYVNGAFANENNTVVN